MKVAGNVKIADAGDIEITAAGKVDVSDVIGGGICFGVGFDFGIGVHSLFRVDGPYDGATGFDFVDFGNHSGLAVV